MASSAIGTNTTDLEDEDVLAVDHAACRRYCLIRQFSDTPPPLSRRSDPHDDVRYSY